MNKNTFWLVIGFLGGLFAVVENGHELYLNFKGRSEDDCEEVKDES